MPEIQNSYKLLDGKTLAPILNVSPWTIDNWRKSEGLITVKVGGRFYYRLEAVQSWLAARETSSVAGDAEPEEFGTIRAVR